MVDGALWALAVEGGRGDWNVVFALVAAAFWTAAFGTVWLGRGESDGDSELETNERLESAYRALSGLVAAFVAECAVMKLLAQMDFTREIMSVFRKLSPRLFSSEEDREKLVDSAQEHLDSLIAREIDPDEGEEE
jgi:hypothetical protein